MSFILTDEQAMLRDAAQRFISEHGPVSHLRSLRDSGHRDGFSRELWSSFGKMGLAGVLVPTQYGGLGLGHVEMGLVMQEIGRNLTPSPFLSTAVLAATALVHGGRMHHKEALLPAISSGDLVATLAVDERTKHSPTRVETRAERYNGGYRLNGTKSFVVDGHVSAVLIVVARTAGSANDTEGLTLFVVNAGTKGLTLEPTRLADAHVVARVTLTDVEVTSDTVIGEAHAGWNLLEIVLDAGRAAAAAELVGAGTEALHRTVGYLKERKQFGRLIGEFQALQHRAAHVYTELELARAAVLKALSARDHSSPDAPYLTAVAKAKAGAAAGLAAQEAVQMHGGIGMSEELDIGWYLKRTRVLQEFFGDTNFHADRVARINGY
jgi:alkylation response protein AidB-like acyl-CoA dehydrogenase